MPVTDRTGNHVATLAGATVSDDEIVAGEPGAIDHGASGYATTDVVTRRNRCPNPRAAVDTSGWTNSSLTTFERVTSLPSTSGLPTGITEAFHGVGDANLDCGLFALNVVSGSVYRVSAYVHLASNTASGIRLRVAGEVTGATFSTVGGGWTRLNVSFTGSSTTSRNVTVEQVGSGATNYYWTGFLLDSVSTLNPYFDGAGYVNGSGAYVASGGLTGWTGTAHNSSSDTGLLGNGKTITLGGVAQRTDESDADTLIAGNASSNATQVKLASGSGNVLLIIGGTTYTFTAAWPSDAAPHFWVLVFDEVNDTADLYIDGELFEAKTSVTAQHAAGQSLVLGAHGAGSDPFDGLSGFQFGAYGEVFSEAELEVLADAAGVG